ncbi:MAG: PIG-L family deacetylase [Gemmatimonadales bacterium]
MIGAHPDDEDTELLTWVTRHVGADAAYLSLTRGEGGQNLIGDELGVALGLLRTRELEAARAIDGAHQFFTRAYDFGFTRSLEETERFWSTDSILKDVVRIIRRFRPHVIVTVFSGTPRDGHGQHQYSGQMALRGFAVAGDRSVYPALMTEEGLEPWTPLRLFRARAPQAEVTLEIDGGVMDHRVGKTIHQMAMDSRSQHRSQNFGSLQTIGPTTLRLALLEDRTGAGSGSLFAGVPIEETPVTRTADSLRRHLAAANMPAVVMALANTPGVPAEVIAVARGHLRDVRAPQPVVAADASVELVVEEWAPGDSVLRRATREWRPYTASNPYFLDRRMNGAMYDWSSVDPAHRGLPFQPGPTATFRLRDQVLGEVRQQVRVVPRIGVAASPEIVIWPDNDSSPRTIELQITSYRQDSITVDLQLTTPGWLLPMVKAILLAPGESRQVPVRLPEPPSARASYPVRVWVFAQSELRDSAVFFRDVRLIDYPHIAPVQYLPLTEIQVAVAPITLPELRNVGYVRGAADRIPEVLTGIGLPLTVLDSAVLATGDLSVFDVIVVGPRAYEADANLVRHNARLLAYARDGGRLVVQYQQYEFVTGNFAPYPLTIRRPHDRITDETAPVRLLQPDHAVFRTPNRITDDDWLDWPQERGLYFAGTWDDAYVPLLEMQDPGLDPVRGGLLTARVGAGSFIYTGISFFRAIPAGNAGALRLFLNLLAFRGEP